MTSALTQSPLGKETAYIAEYDSSLLYPIPRELGRTTLGIRNNQLPFKGADTWSAFELSWLNPKGKPMVAMARFVFPCESPKLIESKSFKLYLNSFNNTAFLSLDTVTETLKRDLSAAAQATVEVEVKLLANCKPSTLGHFSGLCLDTLDVDCDTYSINPHYLSIENEEISETLYSDLLKSNCPVTGQPDWASVRISYTGKKIKHAGLLQYIVSFRNHSEFHELCVERIFCDLWQHCQPQKLSVEACYTRRGGLDINPSRSSESPYPYEGRLLRQ